jgi:hypothetical protein
MTALKDDKALAELAAKLDAHANQIAWWMAQLVGAATGIFLTAGEKRDSVGPSARDMQGRIGNWRWRLIVWRARGRIDGASTKK